MKINYRIAKDKYGNRIKVPIIDVRDGEFERAEVNSMVKDTNGNMSKYVSPKYGYGTHGQVKY